MILIRHFSQNYCVSGSHFLYEKKKHSSSQITRATVNFVQREPLTISVLVFEIGRPNEET